MNSPEKKSEKLISKPSLTKRSPLAKRFIIYIILFSASITLLTSTFQLYNEYQRDIKNIESQFIQIEKVHLRSFVQSLWATNYHELRIQMEGMVKLPNIIYASVYNNKELIVKAGLLNSTNVIKRQYEMRYEFLGKQHLIGDLTVVVTLDDIYSELLRDAITIFSSNALRTLLVVIFIYIIFYQLVGRHIHLISAHFQQLALDRTPRLTLERKKKHRPDELDSLVDSANDMQKRLSEAHFAFRESEKKYHVLTTVSPVGIFYTDANGYCLYVNDKWCEITGMSSIEAEGDGWMKGLHPEDKSLVLSRWEKAAQENVPFKLEYRFQANEHIRWVLGQATSQKDDEGSVIGYVGTITDITEKKETKNAFIESEKKLSLIYSQVPGIVYQYRVDTNGEQSLPYVSPAIEKYIGITAEAIMNDSDKWLSLVHPDDLATLAKSTSESRTHLSIWEWEGRFVLHDKSIVWLHGTGVPERQDDGSTLWNSLFIDVTERILADEAMRRSQKMDALGKLTGGIAHDYNNMLGVVLGYSELLKEELSEQPELREYAEKIIHTGERGAKLTNRLLAFSKGKSFDYKNININMLLKEEQQMLKKTLTARITLELKLAENLWPVHLDEGELEDAIVNISINAMHAIDGQGQMTVETQNVKINTLDSERLGLKTGDYVQLSISDSGIGMDDTTKEKIFDPFYSTKGDKGTGLGLSQVYGFVQRSGGAIKVESQLDHGSLFLLYFPRSFINDKHPNISLKPAANLQNEREASILVVDDESALLELTCKILKQKGYKVFRAEDAQQALGILKIEHIDIMVSDIVMPDMDGYALAAIVQDTYPDMKIQLVSGFSGEAGYEQTDNILSKNLLKKPLKSQVLLERIQFLLA